MSAHWLQITGRNEKGETLLHVAAIEGRVATVRQLIREASRLSSTRTQTGKPGDEARYMHVYMYNVV